MGKTYSLPNTVAIMLSEDSKLRMSYTNIANTDQAKILPFTLYKCGDAMSKIYTAVSENGTTLIFNEDEHVLYYEGPNGSCVVLTIETLNKVLVWLQGGL